MCLLFGQAAMIAARKNLPLFQHCVQTCALEKSAVQHNRLNRPLVTFLIASD